MAGFSKAFVIGGEGGYMGSDGINPIEMFILVGDADRQWLEPLYVNKTLTPIGKITKIIPHGPDDPEMLLDACLAFAPKYFMACPSLKEISQELRNETRLDFHIGNPDISEKWDRLRIEARGFYSELPVWSCNFTKIEIK